MDKPVDKVDNSSSRHKFSHSGPVVGLFAKQPLPGRVKTRLTPPLSADQACQLYSVALHEIVERLLAEQLSVVICYDGERGWFEEAFPGVPLLAQAGDGLGARMSSAVQDLFASGAAPVALAGSDNPDLPMALVKQVFTQLQQSAVATSPCRDGGFAVIGMQQATTALFADIPWSTPLVLAATRRRCQELGLAYSETEPWEDLDEVEDLRRLVSRSPESQTARHIVAELNSLL